MSLLLRTIKSYPRGKLAEELIYLLDKDCDPHKRISVFAELTELEQQNLVFRDSEGKWRGKSTTINEDGEEKPNPTDEGSLEAVPGHFQNIVEAPTNFEAADTQSNPDIKRLLSYFKMAVRADPRGALGAIPETHGTKWQLITGGLPQFLGDVETQLVKLSIRLEDLPGTFRQALLKREESDKSITLGWPICTGVDRSAPKVWPVGLFSGQYERTDKEFLIEFDLQNLFVNPLWARENHRNIGWTQKQLQDLFQIGSALPVSVTDFIEKLREAVAGHYTGNLTAQALNLAINTSS